MHNVILCMYHSEQILMFDWCLVCILVYLHIESDPPMSQFNLVQGVLCVALTQYIVFGPFK